jgi:integrase/recombinase XerD
MNGSLASTLQGFFTERLVNQRHASANTVAAYRDAWRLLLRYANDRIGKQPCQLDITDLNAAFIATFLAYLEQERGNSVRTRNARLAAIRSLFRYAALRHPEHAATIARVLAMPPKRFDQALVTFLTEPEVQALLAAPDTSTRTGRRDRALLLVAADTGLRISELSGLSCGDVHLGASPTSAATARDARTASLRCACRPLTCSAAGLTSAPATPPIRCSPTGADSSSAATRSSVASPSTAQRPPRPAPRCTTRRSPPMSFVTALPCDFSRPGSTPP